MARSSRKLRKIEHFDRETYRFSSIEGVISLDAELLEKLNDPEQLYKIGNLLKFKQEYGHAIDTLEKAYKLFSKRKDFMGMLKCLIDLAWLKYNHEQKSDRIAKSSRHFTDAETMLQAHVNEPGVNELRARLLHFKGLVKYREGEYGHALQFFKQAKTFCNPRGPEAAKILDSLGIHYEKTGDFPRAARCLQESLEIKKQSDAPWEVGITSQIIGRLYLSMEDYDSAQQYLEAALEIAVELNDFKRSTSTENLLIKLNIQQGRYDIARTMLDNVEKESRKWGYVSHLGFALLYRSFLLFRDKHTHAAHDLLKKEIIPLFRKLEHKKGLGKSYRMQAMVLSELGETTKAIELMGEAIALFKEANLVDEQAKSHFELAKVYMGRNDRKLALACLLEALRLAEFNGLRFLTSYIEDEIYRIDADKWNEIVQKRTNHERIFEKERTLLEALSALSEDEEPSSKTKPGKAVKNRETGDKTKSLISLLRVGQAMAAERDLEKLLYLIKDETERALDAERCTVFLYDSDRNELWSKIASGLHDMEELRFPAHLGLAGYVCKTGEVLNIQNAYEDPRFNKEIDKKTGYTTHNLLCIPMRNRNMEVIGVFQVLNKRTGYFEKADEDLLMAIAASAGVAIENAQMATDQKVSFESFIRALSSTIDARDPITAGHSERVAEYSILLGEEMKLIDKEVEALYYASLLHDIGKVGIKEDILVKDGRLTQKEYRHIQKHAYYTYEILKNIKFERHLKFVPEIAAAHHEKMDGSGYFRGLKGSEIPLSGRILALSDVFDAVTSRRHYRNRMPFDKVLAILGRDAGSHFDPDCVEAFFNVKLWRLGHILVMEQRLELPDLGLSLIRDLDRNITVREYGEFLQNDKMTKEEADIHRNFMLLYHRGQLSDLD